MFNLIDIKPIISTLNMLHKTAQLTSSFHRKNVGKLWGWLVFFMSGLQNWASTKMKKFSTNFNIKMVYQVHKVKLN